MTQHERRLRLRVATKLMLAVAFAAVVYVVLSVFLSSDDSTRVMPTFSVELDSFAPGQARSVLWDGRPVLIYRRTAEDIQRLADTDERLRDSLSAKSRQPEWAENRYRSRTPEWFVSIGVGTDFSCPVHLTPANSEIFQDKPWSGGFVDECRGSRYDLSGRVYRGQYAEKNLVVPEYALRGSTLVLGSSR